MKKLVQIPTPLWLVKLTRYEFWPFWIFYLPALPIWAFFALRARSLMYMTAANPGIEMGGFFGESKSKIMDLIPAKLQPKSTLVHSSDPDLDEKRAIAGISYPLIAKPDVGERGNGIALISNKQHLHAFLRDKDQRYLLQAFSSHPLEFGILYYRIPGESRGKIISITGKRFMRIVGDGTSSIRELMKQNSRFGQQVERLESVVDLNHIPLKDVSILLDPIGNHCRGTEFTNCNDLIDDRLERIFDAIVDQMPGFYIGRFDFKVASLEDLYAGRNIDILEVNGTTSEAGHIYDPSYNILKAYRDIYRQMRAVYRVSIAAHQQGQAYTPVPVFLKVVFKHFFGSRKSVVQQKNPVPAAA